ncbi:MAG: hypothetical protein MUE73_07695 [Planctomycetes bacterium]|nr:hypothetical protein [Planctomycetota bacterium]
MFLGLIGAAIARHVTRGTGRAAAITFCVVVAIATVRAIHPLNPRVPRGFGGPEAKRLRLEVVDAAKEALLSEDGQVAHAGAQRLMVAMERAAVEGDGETAAYWRVVLGVYRQAQTATAECELEGERFASMGGADWSSVTGPADLEARLRSIEALRRALQEVNDAREHLPAAVDDGLRRAGVPADARRQYLEGMGGVAATRMREVGRLDVLILGICREQARLLHANFGRWTLREDGALMFQDEAVGQAFVRLCRESEKAGREREQAQREFLEATRQALAR